MEEDESLWQFALRQWRHADVEQRCLQLQDHYQAPVSLLLLGCWLGLQRRRVDPVIARELVGLAQQLERCSLRPLRARRRRLRGVAELAAIKTTLQGLELLLEQRLLGRLQARSVGLDRQFSRAPQAWLRELLPDCHADPDGRRLLYSLSALVAVH